MRQHRLTVLVGLGVFGLATEACGPGGSVSSSVADASMDQGGTGGVDSGAGGSLGGAGAAGTGGSLGGTGGVGTGSGGAPGACTTSFGPGSTLLFAFDKGANPGWSGNVDSDPGMSNLAASLSLGASVTDGKSCPGAVTLTTPFTTYGPGGNMMEQVALNHNYGTPLDWTAYSKIHFWAKLVTDTYEAVNGVQAFVSSGPGYSIFTGKFARIRDNLWHEIVIDFVVDTPLVMRSLIDQIGIEVQLVASTPPDGGPATPTPVTLLVDDIWLEGDGAGGAGGGGGGGGQSGAGVGGSAGGGGGAAGAGGSAGRGGAGGGAGGPGGGGGAGGGGVVGLCPNRALVANALFQNMELLPAAGSTFATPDGFLGGFYGPPDVGSTFALSAAADAHAGLKALSMNVPVSTGFAQIGTFINTANPNGCLDLSAFAGITFFAKGAGELSVNISQNHGHFTFVAAPLTAAYAQYTVTWAQLGFDPPVLIDPGPTSLEQRQLQFQVAAAAGAPLSLFLDDISFTP